MLNIRKNYALSVETSEEWNEEEDSGRYSDIWVRPDYV
jgi:hypothetical protein